MNDHLRGIYQPASDNAQVYDLEDDDADDEERSRLPLMIVVAFIVLAAFTGVVWLAYNQGVARGRSGASVVINAPSGPVRTAPAEAGGGTPFTGLKIYSQPVPPDQEAQGSAVASAAPAAPPPRVVSAAPAPAPLPEATTEAPPVRLNPELRTATPAPTPEAPRAAPPVPQPTPAQPSAPPPPVTAQAARPAPQPLPAAPPPAVAPAVRTAQAPAPAPPPAAAPPPSAPQTNAAAVSGGAVLQIGAFESEALANGVWATFKARHADVVGGLSEDIQKADLGARGTFYRLRVGPFTDRASAVAACEKLKAQRASCLVAAP